MNHKGAKIINSERLILRPFQAEDAEPMFRNWASDPEVTKFLTWPAHENIDCSRQSVENWVKGNDDPGNYVWAIELKEIHEPIGTISVLRMDERTKSASVSYCIGRHWWGRGIMAEALQAVIAFLFEEVGLNCVNACHDPRNPNSGKVMKKCGMTYEGTWRAGGINNQGVCDESWYSILRSEYGKGASGNILIRPEEPEDYRKVEELTKKAFWNVNVPGCDEHYVAHILRQHEDFIHELDFVAVTPDGKIVGNVMYTKARLTDENGQEATILTFGPISVHPDYQRKGISKMLLEYSFNRSIELGYKAIVIFGNPGNYVSRGFKSCIKYNVCTAGGGYPSAMLVKELTPGLLDGRKWIYHESPAYEFETSDADQFDEQFEAMNKAFRPSQEEFFIHSHSEIKE